MKPTRFLIGLAALIAAVAAVPFGYQAVTGQPIGANTILQTDAPSGTAPAFRANGSDTNISINMVPKGTGTLQVNGAPVATGGGTVTALTVNPGPFAVTGTTNLTGPLFATPGTSVGLEGVGGLVLANSSTNATTSVAGVETDLLNFTVLANTLSANNQYLWLQAFVRNAATANNKQTRVYFGATTIGDSTAVAANNNWWQVDCLIWRTGAATQKAICKTLNSSNGGSWATGAGSGSNISTPAETLSGPVVLRVTGTDAVAAAGTNLEAVNLLWYPAGQ
jgi:hypothetical protein